MAFEFGDDERITEAIRRSARQQLELADRQLRDESQDDPVTAVHEARKAIKKERSLLRLARGAMPRGQRVRENSALRDVGRGLSSARDADVMLQALDGLSDRYAGQLPKRTFTAARKRLELTRDLERAEASESEMVNTALQELDAILARVEGWDLAVEEWPAVDAGLTKAYRRGRKALRLAREEPSLENLHALRKRVKDLWYHLRLLTPICGPTTKGQAKEAHRLADALGEDHDLGVLHEKLVEVSDDIGADVDALLGLIDLRRRELQAEAIHAAERLYAESPKAFRRRLRRSWLAGRVLGAAQRDGDPSGLSAAARAKTS